MQKKLPTFTLENLKTEKLSALYARPGWETDGLCPLSSTVNVLLLLTVGGLCFGYRGCFDVCELRNARMRLTTIGKGFRKVGRKAAVVGWKTNLVCHGKLYRLRLGNCLATPTAKKRGVMQAQCCRWIRLTSFTQSRVWPVIITLQAQSNIDQLL